MSEKILNKRKNYISVLLRSLAKPLHLLTIFLCSPKKRCSLTKLVSSEYKFNINFFYEQHQMFCVINYYKNSVSVFCVRAQIFCVPRDTLHLLAYK